MRTFILYKIFREYSCARKYIASDVSKSLMRKIKIYKMLRLVIVRFVFSF